MGIWFKINSPHRTPNKTKWHEVRRILFDRYHAYCGTKELITNISIQTTEQPTTEYCGRCKQRKEHVVQTV